MTKLLKSYYLELISLIILLISIPTYSLINFMQNDDWVYYQNISNLLQGNFLLHPKTAPSFYTISFLAGSWSYFFGIKTLPFLTLIISILNFYIFAKILELKFNFSKLTNILISGILLTNFIHTYSSIGFMTENYLIFFLLLSIYYFEKSEKLNQIKFLHISNIFSILTFFVKQSGIIFICASVVYFAVKKEYLRLKIQLTYLVLLATYYVLFFPKTLEMQKKNFILDRFYDEGYIYSLIYGMMLYLAFFTIPLIILNLKNFIQESKINFKVISIGLFLSVGIYFLSNKYFMPQTLAWQEFPYFQNVFERTGFLPRTVGGTKYQFKFNFDFYTYSNLISKICIAIMSTILVLRFKKFISIYSISIFGFVVLMFFVSPFFDRYLLFALPLAILFLASNLKDDIFAKVFIGLFIMYQSYFSYFFVKDFILTHNYIWSKSESLAKTIDPVNMMSTGAWTNTYGRNRIDPQYIFSYDSPSKNPDMVQNYKLIETQKLNFWGNLFINPEIYLYQRK